MSNYTPDKWVVIRLTSKNDQVDKILSGWYGGYLGGDSWRLSSGITKIEDCGDTWKVHNESGSVYTLIKAAHGTSGLTGSVYANLENNQEQGNYIVSEVDIESLHRAI